MKQVIKAPELRFKADDGTEFPDWNEKRLDRVLTIGSGKDYKHLIDGNIPVYGSGGLMLYVNDFLYDGDSVGIGRKGTINKPIFLSGKFWTVDTLFYTHSFVKSLPKFIYALFLTINWLKYNEAGGVPSLSKSTIGSIKTYLPSLPEQKKIADFLSTVDSKIDALSRQHKLLQQYKKGMLQRLFPAKGEKTPQLRFKADDGTQFPDWEELNLNQIGQVIMGQSPPSEAYNTDGVGIHLIQGNADLKNNYTSPDEFTSEITKTCEYGDIILSVRAPVGAVAKSLHHACIGRGVCAIRVKNGIPEYIYQYLFHFSYLWLKFEQGSTFKAVNSSDIRKFPIYTPSLPEQKKMADFLSTLDERLEATTIQIEQMKTWKRGLLQKMFV